MILNVTVKSPRNAVAYDGTAALKMEKPAPPAEKHRPKPKAKKEAPERKAEPAPLIKGLRWTVPQALAAIVVVALVVIGTLISNAQLVVVNDQVVDLRDQLSDLREEETQLQAQYELAYDLQEIEQRLLASGEMMKVQSWQTYTLALSKPDTVEYHQAWDLPKKILSLAQTFGSAVVEYF